jgi:hypothetical protein
VIIVVGADQAERDLAAGRLTCPAGMVRNGRGRMQLGMSAIFMMAAPSRRSAVP